MASGTVVGSYEAVGGRVSSAGSAADGRVLTRLRRTFASAAAALVLAFLIAPSPAPAQITTVPGDSGTATTGTGGETTGGDGGTGDTGTGDPGAGESTGDTAGSEGGQEVGAGTSDEDLATPEQEEAQRAATLRPFRGADASRLSEAAQRREQAKGCRPGSHFPSSSMLGVAGGSVEGDDGSLIVLVVALLLLGAAAAFVVRRLRPRLHLGNMSALEIAATAVAITAGLAGLAAQFVPGVGVRDRPPPEAAMEVRQVHARVQHGKYAAAIGQEPPRGRLEKLEVGNVVWLGLRLTGFDGEVLRLQWGSYDVRTGAYLPGSHDRTAVRARSHHEARFEPIWVGYPRSGRFQVQFRLLQGRRVVSMARTGAMRGTQYRFACRTTG